MDPPAAMLIERLTAILGRAPGALRPLQGGCVGCVYRAVLADGSSVVVKTAGPSGTLDVEGAMLRFLAGRLPVPGVLHAEPDLLVMEFIEGRSRFSAGAEEHAAELLADLHDTTWAHFGFERDTLIGALVQPNTPTVSWLEFFRDHRLLFMAMASHREGRLDRRLLGRIERLAAHLPEFLTEPARPSLIHGDVWTTNVIARGDRIAAFLDPAICFADPEIELAFITLFDTFGEAFFRAYHARRPIRDGFFQTRRHLYNLYPLLVHVRLFGGSYEAQVDAVLENLGF